MRFVLMGLGWLLAIYFSWFALSYGYQIPVSVQAFDAWVDRLNGWVILASFGLINFASAALIAEPTRLSEESSSNSYSGRVTSGGKIHIAPNLMNPKSFTTIFIWVFLMAIQLGLFFLGHHYEVPLPFGLSAPFTDFWDSILRT